MHSKASDGPISVSPGRLPSLHRLPSVGLVAPTRAVDSRRDGHWGTLEHGHTRCYNRYPLTYLSILPGVRVPRADLLPSGLTTLELHVCRRRRSGDVPGEEVPGLYHDYVRNGDPYRLIPVFHHNMLDVITMGEILSALCRADSDRSGESRGDLSLT